MKSLISVIILIGSLNLYAGKPVTDSKSHSHEDKTHDHSQQEASLKRLSKTKIVIQVKGMVCAFCAQGVETNFKKKKAVKTVKVDLDKMDVTVVLNDGALLSEEEIKDVITNAGFKYVGIKN